MEVTKSSSITNARGSNGGPVFKKVKLNTMNG
jgi:hypothetical protein